MPVATARPISLTASQRHRLKKMAYGHRTPHQARVRAHVVLHAARGRSNACIARETGLHVDTVRTWRGRFADEGMPGPADRQRPGRPPSFTALQTAHGLPTTRRDRHAAGPLVVPGTGPRGHGTRHRPGPVGLHRAPLAGPGRAQAPAAPLLARTGIDPFMNLVTQVMSQEPYVSAKRVFWIVDNGSSHRGQKAADRSTSAFPNALMVHTPVHASWLNQVEIYFSVVQRKVVSPNDFTDLAQVRDRLRAFEDRYNATAQPFRWKFTTPDLDDLLARLDRHAADHQEESSAQPTT
ncbi:helix-turn-helix domain-containing protein (plasmid) [Streptomyces sp. NBC_01591]|uniref:helix-turn-helix domain-containing protein n=1 Tax=Streptomyces sp. NBC_01591 TaxID=2975888 RepID=UPI002DD7B27B|nr:helix-turn-helix domain-containing protein [Streptomyces sp. NBC_01591]WSD74295.1 helix-turn-helix domain-containing protein [Streptomyces sp. NBC_01591]